MKIEFKISYTNAKGEEVEDIFTESEQSTAAKLIDKLINKEIVFVVELLGNGKSLNRYTRSNFKKGGLESLISFLEKNRSLEGTGGLGHVKLEHLLGRQRMISRRAAMKPIVKGGKNAS